MGPVVRIWCIHHHSLGSILGCGTEILLQTATLDPSQLIAEIGGQGYCHAPLWAGLSTPWDLCRDILLFTQFVRSPKRERGKRIWSSVNYLFFLSSSWIYGKNQQVRQSIVWLKDLKGVRGPEMRRVWGCLVWKQWQYSSAEGKGLPLRAVSCKELLTETQLDFRVSVCSSSPSSPTFEWGFL